MQGHKRPFSTLAENLSFDHGSTSSDAGIDSQMSWNNMQTSAQNQLPQTDIQYLHHVGQNGEWSLGETSSSAAQSQGDHSDRKRKHSWGMHSRADPSNILSSDNIDVNANGNQAANASSLLISSPNALPHDLNMHSEFGDHQDDDDCQIIECTDAYTSTGSSNEKMPSTEYDGYVMEENVRHMSHKRKSIEVHVGQSSAAGSSNRFELAESQRSQWHVVPSAQIAASNISMPTQTENNLVINDVDGAVSANPISLTARGSTTDSSRRNLRLRINSNPFPREAAVGNTDVSSSRHSSRLVLHDRLFELNAAPDVENGSFDGLLHAPSMHRNTQSRWSGASSSSRASSSSASGISGERDTLLYDESASRNIIPRSISEHPMFVPASETGISSQQPTNWNLANSSAPTRSNRSSPQYPRRLSEIVRSLLSSSGSDSVGQSSSQHAIRSSSSAALQEAALSSGSDNHGQHIPNSRSALLERHLDGAFGIPYSLRGLAAASEGRSSIMSEIRHVLDLMRRGEGLRFEDVMLLDHSVLFGMADIHDRHRDMRLDVDNMSYEELLALEERIGNVCTGLNEETIMNRLKQRKYVERRAEDEAETEPCSICREEYKDGEDLGTLECGHDFHKDCIKQWLMHKNLCPICKTAGLSH